MIFFVIRFPNLKGVERWAVEITLALIKGSSSVGTGEC